MFTEELSLNNPNKTIWEIRRCYDNGEAYEDSYSYDAKSYVYGTKDELRKYLASQTGYDPNNLIDFNIKEQAEKYCYCPTSINKCDESILTVKVTPIEYGYAFNREDKDEIVFARITCASLGGYVWITIEYVATPTTLDEIIEVL